MENKYVTYNYQWGSLTASESCFDFQFLHRSDQSLYSLVREGTIVCESKKYGVKGTDGKYVIDPVFDQVEWIARGLYLRLGSRCGLVSEDGTTINPIYSDDTFVSGGKVGWRSNSTIVFPAIYDDIEPIYGSSVFKVVNDGRTYFVNDLGEEILTNTRVCPDDVWTTRNKTDIVTIQEVVESKIDNNVVKRREKWVRLDNYTHEEMQEWLLNPNGEKPLTGEDLALYNDSFSYEYTFYKAHSFSKKPITDCLNQLSALHYSYNSWHYIILVTMAPDVEPDVNELRDLRLTFGNDKTVLGNLTFGLNRNANLQPGETQMLLITYYHERCFPSMFEYEWARNRTVMNLDQIKKALVQLRSDIEGEVKKENIEQVWNDQLQGCICNQLYSTERSWEETVEVLDYFKELGVPYKECLIDVANRFASSTNRRQIYFYSQFISWLVENGAELNLFSDDRKTAFDIVVNAYNNTRITPKKLVLSGIKMFLGQPNREKVKLLMLDTIENLRAKGAKFGREVFKEQFCNKDYRQELKWFPSANSVGNSNVSLGGYSF